MLNKSTKTADDSSSQNTSKSTKNKELTTTRQQVDSSQNKPPKVTTDDSTNTINVTNSDKPDDKLSNKLNKIEPDLAEIIVVWPELPEYIKAAIQTLVRTHNS